MSLVSAHSPKTIERHRPRPRPRRPWPPLLRGRSPAAPAARGAPRAAQCGARRAASQRRAPGGCKDLTKEPSAIGETNEQHLSDLKYLIS